MNEGEELAGCYGVFFAGIGLIMGVVWLVECFGLSSIPIMIAILIGLVGAVTVAAILRV